VQIPSSCDVLIVGAGPAGSAAARVLARAGADVVFADQRSFARDKVCGDGLISDALGALDTLGIRAAVLEQASHAEELRVYAPGGRYVSLRGRYACVPRTILDRALLTAAVDAGARFLSSATAVAPVDDDGAVAGARFGIGGGAAEVRARVTLLATGANATALDAFGLRVPLKPMGVAGRAYVETSPEMVRRFPHLTIAYDRDWCPGYGWIFPSPPNRFNIGVGLFGARDAGRLRQFWQAFRSRFAPAREIVAAGREVVAFRGAPLRTGLTGAEFGRPGLLVIGEAAAMTYPATGEGIGKAMESGILAAHTVLERVDTATVHDVYAAEFRRRFVPRYRAYAVAQRWASSPFMLDLLAWRANAGRFVRQELEALVDERGDASALFSPFGLLRALVR
jgi:geranylgeranyl reductase family protein